MSRLSSLRGPPSVFVQPAVRLSLGTPLYQQLMRCPRTSRVLALRKPASALDVGTDFACDSKGFTALQGKA